MSALPPKADIRQCRLDVRKVPLADIGRARATNGTQFPFWRSVLRAEFSLERDLSRSVARLTTVEVPCPIYWPQSRTGSEKHLRCWVEPFWPVEVLFYVRVSHAESDLGC